MIPQARNSSISTSASLLLSLVIVCLTLRYSWHIGDWGNPYAAGGRGGKGIAAYSISSNRLNPMAGCLKKGIPNIARRARNQVLYVVPPFVIAYYAMQWAIER
jgi:ubiquinol-cytochrome c reductase subunit 8